MHSSLSCNTCNNQIIDRRRRLLLDGVELVPEELVHREHVNLILFEDGVQFLVAADLPLVIGVLEPVVLDVIPELLDNLRTGQLEHGERSRLADQDYAYTGRYIPGSLRRCSPAGR